MTVVTRVVLSDPSKVEGLVVLMDEKTVVKRVALTVA